MPPSLTKQPTVPTTTIDNVLPPVADSAPPTSSDLVNLINLEAERLVIVKKRLIDDHAGKPGMNPFMVINTRINPLLEAVREQKYSDDLLKAMMAIDETTVSCKAKMTLVEIPAPELINMNRGAAVPMNLKK